MILLAAFPLLERYGRAKVGLTPKQNLSPEFFDQLVTIFAELENRDQAEKLWRVYRNGLLHTVTLADETRRGAKLPISLLSHDNSLAFSVDSDGVFWLNPKQFAERVLNTIEADFPTFEASAPFPRVYKYDWGRTVTTTVGMGLFGGAPLPFDLFDAAVQDGIPRVKAE